MSRTRPRFRGLLCCTALAAVWLCAHVAPAQAGLSKYPFRIESVKSPRAFELVAYNDGYATITVHLTIYGENIASDIAWPVTRAVPARSSVSIGRLFPDDPKKDTRFGYTKSIQFGDFSSTHAPVSYRLPYMDGSSFHVSQAYGDPLTTHVGHASQYAIDFAMPEGTPIAAARDGVVIDVTLEFEAGGMYQDLKDKANSVVIEHDDGTIAHYAHLAKRDANVRVGQRVKAGALIGHSGNTGYSSGPHLHFAVTKPEVLADGRVGHVSLPVMFYVDTTALPFEARRGTRISASYGRDPGGAAPKLALESRPQHQASAAPDVSEIPVRKLPAASASRPISGEAAVLPPVSEQSPVSAESPMMRTVNGKSAEPARTATAQAAQAAPAHIPTVASHAGNPSAVTDEQKALPPDNPANERWTLLEIALAVMSGALVLLYGIYFASRSRATRNAAL
jgi:murein DD-endopeptidase MepM/ murein hydrolase activator NlpD